MRIQKIDITNVRAIQKLCWELPPGTPAAGWHVIAGDNGSGKSSLLRAVALALVGPETAMQLRQPWTQWLTKEQRTGRITLHLPRDSQYDNFSGKGNIPDGSALEAVIAFNRTAEGDVSMKGQKADRHVWGKGKGWFCASYGPFRRFTGGDPETGRLFFKFPRLGRHLSLFDEKVALTEGLEWLKELRFKQQQGATEGLLLDKIKAFVNQPDFLPFQAELEEVTSEGTVPIVTFVDGNGAQVEVENLSDGYRSVLSMTFDLIRQMYFVYGVDGVFDPNDPTRIAAPGVLLIDEIDAHLHPTWQRRIGFWFREHFPSVQFIVTTHSPLICQAADPGTIYRLPRPGYEEEGYIVGGDEYQRLVYGNVLDAYGTEVFGEAVTSSDRSRGMRERLAALNVQEITGQLSETEQAEQEQLRRTLPTAATSEAAS